LCKNRRFEHQLVKFKVGLSETDGGDVVFVGRFPNGAGNIIAFYL